MSFTIPTANILTFGSLVRHLAQQQMARLRPCVEEQTITGEAAYMEQLAPTGARKVTARHMDSPMMNSQWLRRRIAPYDYDWGDLVDRLDKVRLLVDPTSNYVKGGTAAMSRGFDDEVIAAFFGTAYTGHSGSTAIAWPNGDSEATPTQPGGTQVAINDWSYGNGSGNAGLTISKIISGRVALLTAEGDEDEEVFIGCRGKDVGSLLSTTEFTSSDYQEVKRLDQKKFHGMNALGVTFIHTERLQVNSLGQIRIPMWRKSAMGLGVAADIASNGGPRPDKRYANYVYLDMAIGATRLEEAKLVEIVATK